MATTVLLIDSQGSKDSTREILGTVVDIFDINLLEFTDVDNVVQYVQEQDQRDDTPCLAIIGPTLDAPIQAARRIRRVVPDVHFDFLVTPEDPLLARKLHSPISGLGKLWEVLDISSEHFSAALSKSLSSAIKRRKFRTTLSGLQNKLQESTKPNISELQRYSVSLRFLSHIFEHAHEAIIATTCDGIIVKWNLAAQALFGISHEAAVGKPVFQIAGGEWPEQLQEYYDALLTSGSEFSHNEISFNPSTEPPLHVGITLSVIKDVSGDAIGVSAIMRDITERKTTEKVLEDLRHDLERMSYEDGLTGVPNRRMFDTTLQKEWRRLRRNELPLSLVLIDIDYFKDYNDFYGHQQGDNCLKRVAQTLQGVVGRSPDLVARYGGEEFVILLPETEAAKAYEVATKCCAEIRALAIPHEASQANGIVTISVGISTVVPEQNNYKSILEAADNMLYQAKKSGRNQVCR